MTRWMDPQKIKNKMKKEKKNNSKEEKMRENKENL